MTNLFDMTNTYSIIAYDPESQKLGAAMQTHNFAACNSVMWVQPGVGVIASQAASDPFYAFAGFELMRLGKTPEQILTSLRQSDEKSYQNQVAMMDIQGRVAAFTGERCTPAAGPMSQVNTMLAKPISCSRILSGRQWRMRMKTLRASWWTG
ncbi:MAG: DUF1028 domain-containing protein [Chloroflexota bacterium]